jgi:hypothetical protein
LELSQLAAVARLLAPKIIRQVWVLVLEKILLLPHLLTKPESICIRKQNLSKYVVFARQFSMI